MRLATSFSRDCSFCIASFRSFSSSASKSAFVFSSFSIFFTGSVFGRFGLSKICCFCVLVCSSVLPGVQLFSVVVMYILVRQCGQA